jgi:hypothetical protein
VQRLAKRLGGLSGNDLRVLQVRLPPAITDAERAEIMGLSAELPLLWKHPAASVETRKRILRTAHRNSFCWHCRSLGSQKNKLNWPAEALVAVQTPGGIIPFQWTLSSRYDGQHHLVMVRSCDSNQQHYDPLRQEPSQFPRRTQKRGSSALDQSAMSL